MLTDSTRVNGLQVLAEVRIPVNGDGQSSSVLICRSDDGTFVVWSVWGSPIEASNGVYDIDTYERATEVMMRRVKSALGR